MKKPNSELIRKNKKITAIAISAIAVVLIAVILLIALLGTDGTVSYNGDLMAEIGSSRSKGTDIDDEFKKNYTDFCLEVLNDVASTDSNISLSLTGVMSSVALLGASSDGNTYYEVKKALGDEPIEIGKKISSIESRILYNDKNACGIRGTNAILLNGNAIYGVKNEFLKNNKKYFGLMVDRELFDDKTAIEKVMEKYKETSSYAASTDYEPKTDEYMDMFTISDFFGRWENEIKSDDSDIANFEGIKSNYTVPYMKMVSDTAVNGSTFIGITEKLKGNFTFVGLCPKAGENNEYYSAIEIINELKSTGKFRSLLNGAQKIKVGVKFPYYTNSTANNKSFSLVPTLKRINIDSVFKKDAGLTGITEDYNALHLDEYRVSGDISLTYSGITNSIPEKAKDYSEEYEKCDEKLIFDHSFPYFIIDNETNLPIYFGIFNNID